MKTSMAIDQFGVTYHDLGPRPRKALLEKLGRKSAKPMFVDSKDGGTYQTGWVIGGLWLNVFSVEPMMKKR